ncbi:MAG: PAS domain S-box protein [Candidatus Nealsonbacteria bacterium]|nr:PAS domain S-box protein [Candidatus Nealsonbacteria bacterium]
MTRILVVEDEEGHVGLIRRAFEARGVQADLDFVGTLEEARQYLAGPPPDLLIADVLLPDGRGTELLTADDRSRAFPAVIMTSFGDEHSAVVAMKAGALDYVVKSNTSLGDMPHIAERVMREWENIVGRQEAQQRLQLLSSATEQSTEGIGVADLDGNLLFLNDALAAMHGYTSEELLGKHIAAFHLPEQMPAAEAVLQQIRETGEFSGEVWHARRDGTTFPALMHNSLMRDESGNPVGMIGTARDITESKQVEIELAKHRDHLEELVEERTAALQQTNRRLQLEIAERKRAEQTVRQERLLLRRMLDLQERERRLVSYDIHDGLAQQLAGAMLQFQTLRRFPDEIPEQARGALQAGLDLLGEGLGEARRLIGGLRPPILDESGVVAAIDYLICEYQKQEGPVIEFHHDVSFDRLAAPLETAVFRIVQETLTNACRHSKSPRVSVKLIEQGDRVAVEIRDWGIGFDTNEIGEDHFGVRGIRERARLLGGQAAFDTAPGKGTRVTVDLPLLKSISDDVETRPSGTGL